MEQTIEQAPTQQVPTDAQVDAAMQGQDTPVQAQEAPAKAEAAPAPAFNEESVRKMLYEMLNPIKSELGQFRKLQSTSAQKPTYTPPKSLADYSPEQMKASEELVNHILQTKYGEKFQSYDKMLENNQNLETSQRVMTLATRFAGKDFEALDPFMAEYHQELQKQAEEGDDEATAMLEALENPQYAIAGARALVAEAKERYARSLGAQANGVKKESEAKARRAATTVSNAAPQVAGDWKSNMPRDTKSRLAFLSEQMDKAGM